MGDLGRILLLIHLLICCHGWDTLANTLPACEASHFRCMTGRCIPRLWRCDGERDCDDGSDELRCGMLKCKRGEFACGSRRCVSLRLLCNGADDCGDGSDEASCQNCTEDYFSCGTGTCVPRAKLCDGRPDCPDGRDEGREACPVASSLTPPACSDSEFRCGSGQCVPHSWRCDHNPDCDDGSDEHHCDQNECLVNNGGCSHVCVDAPMGFHCDCPSGMRLVGDSRCEEIDKCLDVDVCSQRCVHVNGSFICDCHDGYRMSPGTGECRAEGRLAQLAVSGSGGVWLVGGVGTGEQQELAPGLLGRGVMAAFAANRTLYWASGEQGAIYRISLEEKSQGPLLVLKGHGAVLGLAVDWIHKLLYFTNTNTQSVNVARLDGSAQRCLMAGLDKPTGVAVEPLLGLLFWADGGSSPRIERANMDGRDRTALVTSVILNPVAISLDSPRRLLYWSDAGMRTVSRVDFNGQHRKTVVESNGYLDKPFGLAVFETRVYWSDETTHSICSADKHNGSVFQVLLSGVPHPAGLVFIHPVLQPKGSPVCGSPKAVCQQQCVPDLFSDSRPPRFTCISSENRNGTVESHAVPVPSLSDTTFAGIILLIVLLSVVLVATAWRWWREEFRPPGTVVLYDFSLKESQDPLIHSPGTGPQPCSFKDTPHKLDLGHH